MDPNVADSHEEDRGGRGIDGRSEGDSPPERII